MRAVIRFLFLLFAVFFSLFSNPARADSYLEQLIERADQLQLHEHPYWLKLVHYQPDLFGGYTSEALNRDFFNSENGRTDPRAELHATLAAFFSDIIETDKQQNPQCRFIARYHWLDSQLEFDPVQLEPQSCQRFEDWYKTIDPHQVTLIFPAGTDNSPSSMFGHTLIRIDRKDQTERTRLFSYSINYAAETGETNGIIFAYKGIFGGYPGRFSIMPYYEKVNQYNQMENRDIWEYQLNLTGEEIDRLLRHAWEVGQIDFAYYFFLENCSYRLLELLDIARPQMNTADAFDWYAIPGDTVHVALKQQGLLNKAVYRPSARTRLKHTLSELSPREREWVLQLADGSSPPSDASLGKLPAAHRSALYETAYDYVQYQHNRGDLDRDVVAPISYRLLKARSELDAESYTTEAPTPDVRLDQGHGSSRLALGYINEDHRDLMEIRLRPAYHDLLDPRAGYTEGAQINFFDFNLRHDFERDRSYLHSLRLVDIVSLVGRDDFFKPVSWKFNMGLERWPIDAHPDERLVFALNGGGGLAFSFTDSFKFFALADATLLGHDRLEHRLSAGIGPNVGFIWDINPHWRTMVSSRSQRFADDLDLTYVEHRMSHAFHWNRHSSIRFEWLRRGPDAYTTDSIGLSWHWYFK